ncbi:MAG: SRPBCC family protein [Anaerolineae bacterium]|jgi:ligand-binding SRPBCC domain-containing protein|nr:SRPBCC family protein [Anaerolineae bacterium]MBT7989216.1 SRPBCC family protein [Anaerolineae bacterium]
MIHRLYRQQIVPASLDEVWAYFATPQNLNEMTPDDMKFEIVHGGEGKMFQGQLVEYRVQFMPLIKSLWLTEIAQVKEGSYFVDEQRIGPYSLWYHEHRFEAVEGGTQITDQVSYVMPFGFLGDIVHALWVGHRLKGIFDFRTVKVKELFG